MDKINKAEKCDLGDVLRIIRIANDVTAQELAENLEVSPSYISQIEKGNRTPNFEFLKKYANYFEIPVSAILKAQEKNDKEATMDEKFSVKIFRIMKTIENWGNLT
jgi:transcriptional regulator with XRE-family HTH domain